MLWTNVAGFYNIVYRLRINQQECIQYLIILGDHTNTHKVQ